MLGSVRRPGRARWDNHPRSVERPWDEIRRAIDGLGSDDAHIRSYQDGLPVCGHEERIVREPASRGSRNHRWLVDLIDRGAQLTGTESPQRLLEEYELNRRILGVDRPAAPRAGDPREDDRRLPHV